jgi:hypothetical protein
MTPTEIRPKRRLLRRVMALGFGLLFGLILLELGSFLGVTFGLLSARVPTYSLGNSAESFWGDLHSEFGVWHPSNTRYRHQKACFDVEYTSNDYGARDVEREITSDLPRVVVLGDSFMEGYGVEMEDRMSNVLEQMTGLPHLNFGTSGNAGSTHAFAIYRGLASKFRHDAVIAAILPENDFDDDVPKPDRYQAYWHGSSPDYELRYSLPSVADSTYRANTGEAAFDVGHALREFTYTKNVIDLVYSGLKQYRTRSKLAGGADLPNSRFFLYSREEFQRMCHSYEEIAKAAAPRPVVLFTIPRVTDFAAFNEAGRSPLDEELSAWADGIENLFFVPLLAEMQRDHGDELTSLFLSCDPHWSAVGHKVAAEIVLNGARDALTLR